MLTIGGNKCRHLHERKNLKSDESGELKTEITRSQIGPDITGSAVQSALL